MWWISSTASLREHLLRATLSMKGATSCSRAQTEPCSRMLDLGPYRLCRCRINVSAESLWFVMTFLSQSTCAVGVQGRGYIYSTVSVASHPCTSRERFFRTAHYSQTTGWGTKEKDISGGLDCGHTKQRSSATMLGDIVPQIERDDSAKPRAFVIALKAFA